MENLMIALAVGGAMCLLFGVVYPAVMLLRYPLYRLAGGRMAFREYMRSL